MWLRAARYSALNSFQRLRPYSCAEDHKIPGLPPTSVIRREIAPRNCGGPGDKPRDDSISTADRKKRCWSPHRGTTATRTSACLFAALCTLRSANHEASTCIGVKSRNADLYSQCASHHGFCLFCIAQVFWGGHHNPSSLFAFHNFAFDSFVSRQHAKRRITQIYQLF
jgi:hypothetical protein